MIIEAAVNLAPILVDLYDENVAVYVTDTEKYLVILNQPKTNNSPQPGSLLKDYNQTIAVKALKAEKRIKAYVDQSHSALGIPYIAIARPLQENNKTVGVLTVVFTVEKYSQLLVAGEEILANVEEIFSFAENIAATSEKFAATARNMDSSIANVMKDVQYVIGITEEVRKVSAQTKILGVNASIESARAKAYGQGFSVVANEISKLSENTKNAVNKIENNVTNVKKSIDSLVESISQLTDVSESQTQGVSELIKALTRISELTEKFVLTGKENISS